MARSPERLRALGDRRTGVGFDQALLLERSRRPDTAAYYRIFNSDVDEVEQCGNGARWVAALLHRRGWLDAKVRVVVRGGELRVNWAGSGQGIRLTGATGITFEGHVEM